MVEEHISVKMRRGTLQEHDPAAWFQRLLAVNLGISANCNRSCVNCYARSLRDGNIGDAALDSILQDVGRLLDARCIQLTGGEPTCHGDFAAIVKELRKIYKGRLTMFTNGYRLLHYADVVNSHLDAVYMSVYDAEDAATADEFMRLKASSVEFYPNRVVHRRKAVGRYPCWRLYGTVSVQDGRVYPCSVAHGLMDAACVDLDDGWMNHLLDVEAPCDGCVFVRKYPVFEAAWPRMEGF